jgi:hypothetical protein
VARDTRAKCVPRLARGHRPRMSGTFGTYVVRLLLFSAATRAAATAHDD